MTCVFDLRTPGVVGIEGLPTLASPVENVEIFLHTEDHIASVSEYMSTEFETISPDTDIYTLAMYFRDKPVRRFPVVDPSGELVGQVSRRDVLKGIEEIRKQKTQRKRYPDYREPT